MSAYLHQMGLAVHGLILASTSSKSTAKTSSSSLSLLLLVGFGLVLYLLVLRPRSQRMRKAQAQKSAAGIGDEVMLTSGIIGRVTSIEGDRATVEIAPEIEVEVVRRAISQVLNPALEDVDLEVPPDPGSEEYLHDHEHDDDEQDDDEQDDDGNEQDDYDEDDDSQDDEPAEDDSPSDNATHPPSVAGPGQSLDLGSEGTKRK
ncbi:MAG: preprotein translocase subunit YajC [Acidimicrobiales bacterium]|jgi:preprotein translocase subunit YajC